MRRGDPSELVARRQRVYGALLVLMLVIITIIISPLVMKIFKYRWWNVHRTLDTQEEG